MKFFVLTKKQIIRTAAALVAVCLATVGAINVFAGNESAKRLPVYCVETDKKQIAISFDAAWGNEDTETLINILKDYNVKATFFTVGQWVDRYPESVKQLNDAGHSIQNHSSTHPQMTCLSCEQQKKEIEDCNQKIKALTGKTPTLFRAPYGDYNNDLICTAEQLNMYTIQWDVDSLDWKETSTAQSIADRVISRVKNGSIILMHNDAKCTPQALPTILKTLKEQGYKFVLIKDLIYKDNYTIDNTGMQINEGR